MSKRVSEILSWYGSDNPGTLMNLSRILNHGRLGGTGKVVIGPGQAHVLAFGDGSPSGPTWMQLWSLTEKQSLWQCTKMMNRETDRRRQIDALRVASLATQGRSDD